MNVDLLNKVKRGIELGLLGVCVCVCESFGAGDSKVDPTQLGRHFFRNLSIIYKWNQQIDVFHLYIINFLLFIASILENFFKFTFFFKYIKMYLLNIL